jgi:hypothetical protein
LSKSSSFRLNTEESRILRRENSMEIRKRRRSEVQQGQRNMDKENIECLLESLVDDVEMMEVTPVEVGKGSTIRDEHVKLLHSEILYEQSNAVSKIRRLLNHNKSSRLIDEIFHLGLFSRFLELIQSNNSSLQVSFVYIFPTAFSTKDDFLAAEHNENPD